MPYKLQEFYYYLEIPKAFLKQIKHILMLIFKILEMNYSPSNKEISNFCKERGHKLCTPQPSSRDTEDEKDYRNMIFCCWLGNVTNEMSNRDIEEYFKEFVKLFGNVVSVKCQQNEKTNVISVI